MMAAGDVLLRVEGLTKSFGDQAVLDGVSLEIERGSIFAVVGPSGAGKSVLLKCLAGIEEADSGRIEFDGSTLDHRNSAALAGFRRRSSFLFQNNALFDSLTAAENVALPLEQTTNLARAEIRKRSMEALRKLELDAFGSKFPGQLSGGMQKRLALARAIVTDPELVFFDEPTAGLDPLRRNAVFAMIAQYQWQFGFTALIVTHDLVEALATADRVSLLEGGSICFTGTPDEFRASDHRTVCEFRDSANALDKAISFIRQGTRAISKYE